MSENLHLDNEDYIYNPLYFIIAYIEHNYDNDRCPFDKFCDFATIASFEGGLR